VAKKVFDFAYTMSVMRNFNKALAQQNEKIDLQNVDNHNVTHSGENENEIKINTTFAGEDQSTKMDYTPIDDPTFDENYIEDYDIHKYLNRPVLIGTYTMGQNTPSSSVFNVWQLYFNTPQIRKKLDNYFLLNCNLKLKFVVNATPFLYGSILASYEPLPAFSADNVGSGVNANATVLRSQRPHLWIYPQNNQGGEMLLPFYYYQEWLDVTIQGNLVNMGLLTLEDVVALRSASGATSQVATVQIYAWAENVKLAGPTYSLSLQNDEYDMNGPISSTASAVAATTWSLRDVPYVGKYFKATSIFTRGLGQAASLLGYTNTPVIDPTQPFYIQTNPTFASADISFPEHKLTYDPKQELTVDPRVVGLNGVDEMDITNIVQRESYLTQFTWNQSDPTNTNLFTTLVVPWMRAIDGGVRLSNTPMAHIAALFEYWRGDIIIRFRFICSQYHRGRVRITWDPNGDIVNNNDTTPTSITNIVDISETTDVEIRVPFMQPTRYNRVTQNYTSVPYSTGTFSRLIGFDNGNLNVKVFTRQSCQVSSAPVTVLVSVRGAENMEFANPRSLPNNLNYFALQNDEYQLECPTQLGVASKHDPQYITHIGEKVQSLRTILRRRNIYRVAPLGRDSATSSIVVSQTVLNRLPIFPGYDPNGVDLARNQAGNANVNYNWVFNTPYHWLAGCYLGCRGSVNYYYEPMESSGMALKTLQTQRWVRNLSSNSISTQGYNNTNPSPYIFLPRFFAASTPDTNEGSAETLTETSKSISAQYPYYSRFRMRQCDPTQAVLGSNIDDSRFDGIMIQGTYQQTSQTAAIFSSALKMYFGVGTDFTFLFFLNTPLIYIYSPPAGPA
jgi:hypothetical protein